MKSLPPLKSRILATIAALAMGLLVLLMGSPSAFDVEIPVQIHTTTDSHQGELQRADLDRLLNLSPSADREASVELLVPLNDAQYQFSVSPSDIVSDATVTEITDAEGRRRIPAPNIKLFAGRCTNCELRAGEPGFIRFSISPSDGRVPLKFDGAIGVNETVFFVQGEDPSPSAGSPVEDPLQLQILDQLAIEEVVAANGQTAPSCGTTEPSPMDLDAPPPGGGYGSRSVLYRQVNVGTDAAFHYTSRTGGVENSLATIRSLLNQVAGIYEAQLGLRLRIAYQHGWDTDADPYPETGANAFLDVAESVLSRPEIRDFYGLGLMQAWVKGSGALEGTIVGRSSYGVCQRPSVVTKYSGNTGVSLSAHELGHDLGLPHEDSTSNIMRSILSSALNFTPQHISFVRGDSRSCFQPVTDEGAVPGAITNVSVQHPVSGGNEWDQSKIQISWERASEGGPVATFQIFRSNTPVACQGTPLFETQGNTWTDASPPWGSPSYYSVRAINSNGAGLCSPISSIPLPTNVTISRGLRSSSAATLTVGAAAPSGLVGLYIWRGAAGPTGHFDGIGEATLNVQVDYQTNRKTAGFEDRTAPADGSHRWYTVLACNISGCTPSAVIEAFRYAKLAPPSPISIIPAEATDRIILRFSGSSLRNAYSFTIYRKLETEQSFTPVGTLYANQVPDQRSIRYEDTRRGWVPGNDVQYYVIADDEIQYPELRSDPSQIVTGYTLVAPSQVSATQFMSANSPGLREAVRITWQPTARGANGYVVERAPETPSDAPYVWIAQTGINMSGNSFDDAGVLADGSRYRHRVKAFNNYAAAPSSSVLGSRDPRPALLSSPSNREVTAGDTAQFSATFQSAGPLTYQWYRNSVAIPNSNTTTLTVSGVGNGDDGARYHAAAVAYGLPFGTHSTASAPATLTVNGWLGGLSASDGTSTSSIALSWTPITTSRVVGYDLFRSTSNTACAGTPTITVNFNSISSTSDSDVTPGVNYYYSGRPRYSGGIPGICGATDVGYVKVSAPSFSASPNASTGEIVINKPSNVNGATNYLLYRSTESSLSCSGTPLATLDPFTSYADRSVAFGSTYYYRMQARGANGTLSDCTAVVSGQLSLNTPSLQALANAPLGEISLNVQTPVFGASSYLVFRSIESSTGCTGTPLTTLESVTTHADRAVSPGITYYYRAQARAANGSLSACSPPASSLVQLLSPTLQTSPAQQFTDKVQLSWAAVPFAQSYLLFRSSTNTACRDQLTSTGDTSYEDTSVVPGGTYYYSAKTVTSSGLLSACSPVVAGTTDLLPVITTQPSDLFTTTGASSAFSVVASSPRSIRYQWYKNDQPLSGQTSAILNIWPIQLSDDQNRYYVRLTTSQVNYVQSRTATLTIRQPVSSVSASDATSTDGVDITWAPMPHAVSYSVYRGLSSSESCSSSNRIALGLTEARYFDASAVVGINYYYRVGAVYADGSEAACSPSDLGSRAGGEASGIINFAATLGSFQDRVYLSWDIPQQTGIAAVELYRSLVATDRCAGTSLRSLTGRTLAFNDTEPTAGVDYFYSARLRYANNSLGTCTPVSRGFRGLSAPNFNASSSLASRISLTISPSSAVARWELFRSTSSEACMGVPLAALNGPPPSSYEDSAVEPGLPYHYSIKYFGLNGAPSLCSSIRMGVALPATILGISASDKRYLDRIEVSWPAQPRATSYRITTGANCSGASVSVTSPTYTNTGLPAGTARSYYVQTVIGGSYMSACSAPASGYTDALTTISSQPTDSPEILLGETAAFEVAASSVPYPTRFQWYRNGVALPNETAARLVITPASIADDGSLYSVRVSAGGASFLESRAALLSVLAPPHSLTTTPDEAARQIRITWQAQARQTSFELYRSPSANDRCLGSPIASPEVSEFTDQTVNAGATYFYSVRGRTASGTFSPCSTPQMGSLTPATPTPTPTSTPTHTPTASPTAPPSGTPTIMPTATPPPPTDQDKDAKVARLRCSLTAGRNRSLTVSLVDETGRTNNVSSLGLTQLWAKLRIPDGTSLRKKLKPRSPKARYTSLKKGRYSAKIQMRYGKRKLSLTCNKIKVN